MNYLPTYLFGSSAASLVVAPKMTNNDPMIILVAASLIVGCAFVISYYLTKKIF